MSHQPFEAWIFQDEELSPEAGKALQAHLDECQRCRDLQMSWQGARSALNHPEMMAPEPGFEIRWRTLRQEDRRRAEKRQISWALGLTILAAAMVALPLALQVYAMLQAPAAVGGTLIRDILEVDLTLRLAGGLVRALVSEATSRLAPAGWAGLGIALFGFTATWMFSLYHFVFQPIERGG
jgi:predicted anti-sigma-YlaC factor YlaD